ncbi:7103_t:CDS:2 [Scutellospora calospora]|uniref:7103_t:CDS:1 n=1 Tax=Scutellospora calospora TaxID=85575 RepID=A0ACA9L8K2_9GLOM|nr:7103_t:CDS:2 [Scutellospora calospora]
MNNHLLSQLIRDSAESSSENDSNNSNNNIESSSEDEQTINIIVRRYLYNRLSTSHKDTIPKSNFWYRNILFKYDEKRFRTVLRMNKLTFWKIINMIKNNLVFNSRQRPIELQLSVVLFLLGRKSTIWDIATRFVVRGFEQIEGFPDIIGVIDGTHVYLFEAPNKPNKDVYINRKRRYAIHVQGVVDHLGRFINYDIGWPASVHDAKVFSNSSLYTQQNNLFQDDDYILADSAYPISKWCIPSFKSPIRRQIQFNKKHNRTRVVVEQAFGRLKNRFQFLKEIRTNDTKLATKFIDIALILHNIVEKNNDIWILPPRTRSETRDIIRFVTSQNCRCRIEKREGMIKRQNLIDIVL